MGRLTDVRLQAMVRKGKSVAGKSDGDGLVFTITKAGTAIWKLRYRYQGQPRWAVIGRYSDFSLKQARDQATLLRAQLVHGVDVTAEKRRARLARMAAKTMAELAEDYLLRAGPALAEATRDDIRHRLDKHILPRLGTLKIEEVSGAEVVHLVEQVARRSDSAARRCFQILSRIFAHGLAKHVVTVSPCGGLKLDAILGPRRLVREKVALSEAELRTLLAKLPQRAKVSALAIKILLATAARKMELSQARWEDVDFEAATWAIPDEHSKTGKGFFVPLAPAVVKWFEELRTLACGSAWVLPGTAGRDHICHATLNQALRRLKGIPDFTVHDLRRTARSHLAALGVDIIVAERCLNHTLGGLVAIYDRHDYLSERRKALELWCEFLTACEQGRPWKVIPIARAAA